MKTAAQKRLSIAIAALLLALIASSLFAAQPAVHAQSEESVVVLVNARNPTNALPLAEAKKLFLGQTSFWHGVVPVKIVSRPDSSAAAKAFFALLSMTPQSYQKQWAELQLAGRGVAPKTVGPIQDVAALVAQTPGGIGFALASEAWNVQLKGVKIVPIK